MIETEIIRGLRYLILIGPAGIKYSLSQDEEQ